MGLRRRRVRALPPEYPSGVEGQLAAVTAAREGWLYRPERLPVVLACRALIADTVAQLPLQAVRAGRVVTPTPPILAQPDPAEPRWQTFHRLCMSLTAGDAMGGNAFLMVTAWDAADRPVAVTYLPHGEVSADLDELGRVAGWRWRDRHWAANDQTVRHIPNILDPGPLGTSPIRQCGEVLQAVAGLFAFAASYWESAGVPSVHMDLGQWGDEARARAFRDQYEDDRRNRRRPVVTWGDTTVKAISASAVDAALIEALGWAAVEVARAHGMPPSLVNAPTSGSLTYSTREGEAQAFLSECLTGYLIRLEACFTQYLPRGQEARFDVSELLRTDWAARIGGLSTLVAGAALLTVDEGRAEIGYPPIGAAPTEEVTPMADVVPLAGSQER